MSSIPLGDILKLSASERLMMVEAIWDSLVENPEQVPVPASHVKELRRRMADYQADPEGTTVAWEDLKESLRREFGG